jgi:quercetin dioxygenase-like cupin family protein
MTEDSQPEGVLIPAGQGRPLRAGPTRPVVKVGPYLGSHLIGMLESELPPGGGFPGHVHDDYEEAFYVLAGPIDYLIGGTWTRASTGSAVFIPPGQVHGFRNPGPEPARHLAISSPAEAMTMIEELAQTPPGQQPRVLARYRSHLAEQEFM